MDAMVFQADAPGTQMAQRAIGESIVEAASGSSCVGVTGAACFRIHVLQQRSLLASTNPQITCKYPWHITHL